MANISVENTYTIDNRFIVRIDSTHLLNVIWDSTNNKLKVQILTLSSNDEVLTEGTIYDASGVYTETFRIFRPTILDSTHFVIGYTSVEDTQTIAKIGTISNGDEISIGADYEVDARFGSGGNFGTLDSTHFVVASLGSYQGYTHVKVGTVSNGNEISFGAEYSILYYPSDWNYYDELVVLDSTHFVVSGYYYSATKTRAYIGTVSNGNQISFSSEQTLIDSYNGYKFHYGAVDYDQIDSNSFIIAFQGLRVPASVGAIIISTDGNDFVGDTTSNIEVMYQTNALDDIGVANFGDGHFGIYMYDGALEELILYTGRYSEDTTNNYSITYNDANVIETDLWEGFTRIVLLNSTTNYISFLLISTTGVVNTVRVVKYYPQINIASTINNTSLLEASPKFHTVLSQEFITDHVNLTWT